MSLNLMRGVLAIPLLLLLAACGDGDATPTDAGSDAADAGRDTGIFVPRRDSSVPVGDPIPDCDTTDPLACGAGQKCDWVLRFVTAESASVYTGCVEERAERERGVPCVQFGRAVEADGLEFGALIDPCAEGLFCAPDPTVRGLMTCQPLCESTRDCGADSYCAGTPISDSIAVPVCQPSDDCDAIAQSGCGGTDACYLRPNGPYDGALSVCLPHSPITAGGGAPGDPCVSGGAQYISACQPGAVCWGNPRITPDLWTGSDIRCRSYCDPLTDLGDDDAGTGACGTGQCVWLGDPDLALNNSALTRPPGVCD